MGIPNLRQGLKESRRPNSRCSLHPSAPLREYGVDVEYHCKPYQGDWNGSGMHCNFSSGYMRETGGKEYFLKLMDAFEKYKDEHIAAYGPDNHLRLTGLHETHPSTSSLGVSLTVVLRSVSHTASSRTTHIKATSKTAVKLRKAIPTGSFPQICQTVAEVEAEYK